VPLSEARWRPAWADVDLEAVRHNAGLLAARADPAALMAVVKADGYGHGAVPVARAALEGGAAWLGVALVEEGLELRAAGIEAPILVLAEAPASSAGAVVAGRLTPVVYSGPWIEALAKAAADAGAVEPLPVHLKVDTGMHRVGCTPQAAVEVAQAIARHDQLRLEGLLTHLAVADETANPYTAEQLGRFETVRAHMAAAGIRPPVVHAANSAGLLAVPQARYDLVRCGIALYGIPPAPEFDGLLPLRPAMSLRAEASLVRRLEAGERISYGLRYRLSAPSVVATVPLGYADGVPRRLGHAGGEVLAGGRRRPIAGTITMDQLMVDLGTDELPAGTEVVLIGRQGEEEITAAEWAERLDTIAYEVVSAIGPRVPRRYRG
jgi:alanine racemase